MWFWLFLLSMSFSLLLFYYVRWLLKSIAVINTDIENLSDMLSEFCTHLRSVHELEMFYGDETLQALLRHTSEIADRLEGLDLILNEEEGDLAEDEKTKED